MDMKGGTFWKFRLFCVSLFVNEMCYEVFFHYTGIQPSG